MWLRILVVFAKLGIVSRDDPKGPGTTQSIQEEESDDENEVISSSLKRKKMSTIPGLQIPEASNACLCGNCPSVPEEHSKCCHYETKNKAACEKEDVTCIIDVRKMNKIWDKVRKLLLSRLWSPYLHKEVLEIAMDAYNQTLSLGISSPPANK